MFSWRLIPSLIFHWLWSQNAGNGILEAHILNFFSQGSMPQDPPTSPRGSRLQRSYHGHVHAGRKTAIFSWQGWSNIIYNLTLLRCELFNYKLIRNTFSCPGGGAFSAISCLTYWGICHLLRAVKTNPHLYPGVGWVGVYFDWCINTISAHWWESERFHVLVSRLPSLNDCVVTKQSVLDRSPALICVQILSYSFNCRLYQWR